MSERRTLAVVLAFSLIILSACNAQESTPVWPAPALATIAATLPPPTVAVRASITPVPPTRTPTLLPSVTSTPNPKAGKPVTIKTIKMLDAQHGWAVGQIAGDSGDSILFTQDGGITWKNISPAAGSSNRSVLAFFLDARQAWVIYYDQAPSLHQHRRRFGTRPTAGRPGSLLKILPWIIQSKWTFSHQASLGSPTRRTAGCWFTWARV